MYLVAGAGIFIVTSHLRFEFLLKYALYINLAIVGLDFYDHTGFWDFSERCFKMGWPAGVRIQPGEFLKFSLILFAPTLFENFEHLDLKSKIGYAACLCVPLIILMRQPDFGTFSICTIGLFLLFSCQDFHAKTFIYYSFLAPSSHLLF